MELRNQGVRDRLAKVAVASSLVIFLLLTVLYAARRAPWNDEGWFANPALNLAEKGFLGSTVVEPTGTHLPVPLHGIQRYTYWVLPAYLVFQAAWFKVGGFSVLWMRLSSVLFGLIGLVAFYFAVNKIAGDRRVAQLATVLLALDTFYMNLSALARMDMMAVSLGWVGMALFLGLRERNLLLAVAAGYSALALACFTHHQAALAGIGLLSTTIYLDRSRIGVRHLAVAVVPFGLLAIAWGLYGSQHPDYFWAQISSNGSGRLGTLTAPGQALYAEIMRRYGVVYGFEAGASPARKLLAIVPCCYLLAIVAGLSSRTIRRRPGFLFVATVLAIQVMYQFVFEGMKLSLYLIHLIPWYTILLAIWLISVWKMPRLKLAAVAITAVFLTVQVGASVMVIRKNNYPVTFAPVKLALERENRPGALIYGSPELGLEIGFDHLVDDLRLGYYTHRRPSAIVLDARYRDWANRFRQKEPQVFEYMNTLLAGYTKVYDSGGFAIYVDNQGIAAGS